MLSLISSVPSGPVRGLNTSSISSRSVTLTWNPPKASDINSPNGLTGYYVELRRFERNRCEGRLQSTTTKARKRRVTFNNLQPVTAYCVVVFPENEGGRARELHVTSGRHTFTTSGEGEYDNVMFDVCCYGNTHSPSPSPIRLPDTDHSSTTVHPVDSSLE